MRSVMAVSSWLTDGMSTRSAVIASRSRSGRIGFSSGTSAHAQPLSDEIELGIGLHHCDADVIGRCLAVELTGAHEDATAGGECARQAPRIAIRGSRPEIEAALRQFARRPRGRHELLRPLE